MRFLGGVQARVTRVTVHHQRTWGMYLFFVRHFNDIDHIVPVVWRMSQDHYPVAVYCMNPEYDIEKDYRLVFLKDLGVQVASIYERFNEGPEKFQNLLLFLGSKLLSLSKKLEAKRSSHRCSLLKKIRDLSRRMGLGCYELMGEIFFDRRWACRLLSQLRARALCFDWVMPGKFVAGSLLKAAGDRSIPTFSLPHGVSAFSNDSVRVGATRERRFEKFNRYDFVIVQNESRRKYIESAGVAGEKIFVLGSTRYCSEWMAQNARVLPRILESGRDPEGRLRVVFMTTRFKYRIDVPEMFKTFEMLAGLSGLDVVIKPHTRTDREAHLFENLALGVAFDVSSAELVEWADVVLVIATSVAIEALSLKKPLLYLKYLHGNRTLYEEFDACWTVNSERELERALVSLRSRKGDVPYSEQRVEDFLREVVYGGIEQRDVLGDYERLIVNASTGQNNPAIGQTTRASALTNTLIS